MPTEIYYLSGTGNSLHVAKELQKRIPDTDLIPLAGMKNIDGLKTNGESVGFVFPVHFMTAPKIVFSILEKLDMGTAEYIFIIATRYGTPCRVMYRQFEKLLKKKGKDLDSYITVSMANNDPKFKDWKASPPDKLDVYEAILQKKLDEFQSIVQNRGKYREEDQEITHPVNPLMERLGVFAASLFGDGTEEFYSDFNCNGCGTCERVCLSSKIRMVNGKPEWPKRQDCYSCYACLNFCPEKAVQLKSTPMIKFYTEQNGRYHHPEISLDDIAEQKLELADGKVEE
jgi:ferredoxin